MDEFPLAGRDAPVDIGRPPFPSLHWPPHQNDSGHALKQLSDIWRFTILWTLVIYAIFHLGAACITLVMQVGKPRSNWKYLWTVPFIYCLVAGIEAFCAGTIVGLIIGAVYKSGGYNMSTWVPFIWGWVNVFVLIVSSFTFQGGL